jgi:hypothetical protein
MSEIQLRVIESALNSTNAKYIFERDLVEYSEERIATALTLLKHNCRVLVQGWNNACK